MSAANNPNRLVFDVEPIPYFVESLLAGLSVLLFTVAPPQVVKYLQYLTQKMRFPDGTTVTFVGTADGIKQPLMAISTLIWARLILDLIFDNRFMEIVIACAGSLALAYFSFELLRAATPMLLTNHGSRLQFDATVTEYMMWQVAFTGIGLASMVLGLLLPSGWFLAMLGGLAIAVLTLAVSSILTCVYFKWLVSKVSGGRRKMEFDMNPLEFAGMSIVCGLLSIVIVTIPWTMTWFAKWLAGKAAIPPAPAAPSAVAGYPV